MDIIYIDVLIIINLYVTYFLLRGTAFFLHIKVKGWRYAAGSFLGGLSSLVILLPTLNFFLNITIKAVLCCLIVLTVFGLKDISYFLKNSLAFLIINMVYAGLSLILWLFSAPLGMKYNNGYSYFNISFAAILSFTAISYGLIRLIRYWLDSSLSSSKNYEIKVRYKDSDVLLRGFADSGNTVVDYFSGLPVIICGKEKWENILPSKIFEDENFLDHIGHFRLLPFNTVGDSGIMPIFKPDEIIIAGKNISAMIGIAKSDFKEKGLDAVFNPKILK